MCTYPSVRPATVLPTAEQSLAILTERNRSDSRGLRPVRPIKKEQSITNWVHDSQSYDYRTGEWGRWRGGRQCIKDGGSASTVRRELCETKYLDCSGRNQLHALEIPEFDRPVGTSRRLRYIQCIGEQGIRQRAKSRGSRQPRDSGRWKRQKIHWCNCTSRNSFGWNSTEVTAPVCSLNSCNIFPAVRSHSLIT